MPLATLQLDMKLRKCIRIEITIFKFSFGEVYHLINVWKSRFTALLARPRKTKIPAVYGTINLSNENFEYIYPLNLGERSHKERSGLSTLGLRN